jgi:XTP/dITP diphosphohydrolase
MFTLLVATTNRGKIKEIKALLQKRHVDVVGLKEVSAVAGLDVEETGTTFAENAALKAQTYGRLSGLITLADDSGLLVDALDGRPGVFSKRYSDSDNDRISKILEELKNISQDNRTAHFECHMAMYDPSADKMYQAQGKVDGSITDKPIGNNGFGFDPVFFCPALGKTFAEASQEEKNSVSHRGQALAGVVEIIRKHFARKK